jgi:hypothetical protein
MKYLIGAKITSVELINNPLEIEAESPAQAVEKAEWINANDSDQIHHQKMLLEECNTEFFIAQFGPTPAATPQQCPYCFAKGIDSINSMEKPENRVLQTMECAACSKKWVDVYTLTSRENGHAETIQLF